MIDIGKILKRAWHILWNYRVLWIFAFLLALTAGGGGGGNGGGGNSGYNYGGNGSNGGGGYNPNFQPGPFMQELNTWVEHNLEPLVTHPDAHIGTFIWIGVAILLLILLIVAVTSLVRYPTETAIIRMVDEYEQSGVKLGFKQGWKLGWNRRAFRMWLIDFIIGLPVILFLLMLGGLGLVVYSSIVNGSEVTAVTGVMAAGGCLIVFLVIFSLAMVFLGLLRNFFIRAAALENLRVGESFRFGWAMFKRNWKSAALMWLVMLGIGIGAGIALMIVFFLLIPTYVIMAIPAVLAAAIPGAIAFGIASIFASWPIALIVAALFAVPVFFLIAFAPASLVQGWYLVFESNVWTLTYREMKAMESLAPVETTPPVK